MQEETKQEGALAKAPEVEQEKPVAGSALPTKAIVSLNPKSFEEAKEMARILSNSDVVPKDARGKPANVLLIIMHGAEIGLSAAQALNSIMVVNGHPSLWGDAVMGLVLASGKLEDYGEEWSPNVEGGQWTFWVKRKGLSHVCKRTFSMDDAKKSKLASKQGPWQEYPKRMVFHRARSWALRDMFGDVLKGIGYYEELRDVEPMKDATTGQVLPKRASDAVKASAIETEAAMTSKPPVEQDNIRRIMVETIAKTTLGNDVAINVITSRDGEKFYTADEIVVKFFRKMQKDGALVDVYFKMDTGVMMVEQVVGVEPVDAEVA